MLSMAPRKTKAEQPLAEYERKRDFTATPEPQGKKRGASAALHFVVQKHRASRLHYDFRLEAGGVLASWAIPKGPTLDTRERRLAMHVEDHPYDYRTFEGIIPEGNYGAGEVIVWDEGTYALAEGTDPVAEIAKGKIKFIMLGKKLRGMFSLVKIKPQGGESGDAVALDQGPGRVRRSRLQHRRSSRERGEREDDRRHRREQDREAVAEQSFRRSARRNAASKARKADPLPRDRDADARDAGRRAVRQSGVAVRGQVGRLSRDRGRSMPTASSR